MKKPDTAFDFFALLFAIAIILFGFGLIIHGLDRSVLVNATIAGAILLYTGCKIVKTVFYPKDER